MFAAEDVTVHIGRRAIVAGISLAVRPGRVVAVIGPNGAGKSTLLRAMAGERRPSSGRVTLNGAPLADLDAAALASRRAVLAQSLALTAPFPVDAIMRLGIPNTVRESVAAALVERGLAAVDMADAVDRPITHLSGGEQQRIHAARVLVQLWSRPKDYGPRYLLLDEPTSHLDPAHQHMVMGLARAHAGDGGGVLAVLHDLNLAAAVADDIAVLNHGRLVAFGPAAEVMRPELLQDVYGIAFAVVPDGGDLWIRPLKPAVRNTIDAATAAR